MVVANVRRYGTGSPEPRYRGATQKAGREACSRPAHESPDSPGWRPGVKLEPVVGHQDIAALLEADDD